MIDCASYRTFNNSFRQGTKFMNDTLFFNFGHHKKQSSKCRCFIIRGSVNHIKVHYLKKKPSVIIKRFFKNIFKKIMYIQITISKHNIFLKYTYKEIKRNYQICLNFPFPLRAPYDIRKYYVYHFTHYKCNEPTQSGAIDDALLARKESHHSETSS